MTIQRCFKRGICCFFRGHPSILSNGCQAPILKRPGTHPARVPTRRGACTVFRAHRTMANWGWHSTGWFINNGPPCKCYNMGLLNFIALSFWKTKLNQQKNFCLTESWLIVPTYRETRKIPRISKLWLWIESLYKVVIKIPKSDYNVIIFFPKLQ